jgi:O-antigen/teichoic acid export membrane protein
MTEPAAAGLKRLIPAKEIGARFARGAFWSLVANVSSAGLQLVSLLVVARLLGVERFGGLGVISTTVQMLGIFTGTGFGLTATKHVAEWRSSDRPRAGRIIGLCNLSGATVNAAFAALLLWFARPIAAHVFAQESLAGALRISAALLFCTAMQSVQVAALAGLEEFRSIAAVNLLRGAAGFAGAVTGAALAGLEGTIAGLAAGAAAGLVFSQIALRWAARRHAVPIRYRGAWQERSRLWQVSLPGMLSGAISMPAIWLANALLVHQPMGYQQMGIFNAANQWRTAIQFLPAILSQAALPILSDLYRRRDLAGVVCLLRRHATLTFACGSAAAAALCVFPGRVMAAYGSEFGSGTWVLAAMAWSAVLAAGAGVVGTAIFSLGRMWIAFALNLGWALVFLGASWWLVPRGAIGLAAAYLFSYAAHLAVTWTVFYRLHADLTRLQASDFALSAEKLQLEAESR